MLAGPLQVKQADPGPLGQLRLLAALDSWISDSRLSHTHPNVPFRRQGELEHSLTSTHSLWEQQQLHSHGWQELGKAQIPQQSALEL